MSSFTRWRISVSSLKPSASQFSVPMCLVTHHSDTDTIALQGVEALRKLRIKGLAAVGIDKGTFGVGWA